MKGFYCPTGRKGIICTAVGDIVASYAIFAASKRSLGDVSCLPVRNLDLTEMSLRLSVSSKSKKKYASFESSAVKSWGRRKDDKVALYDS